MKFMSVAKTEEIPIGTMKHVEISGKEIMIANVKGRYYGLNDRCGHMNMRLSAGTLTENIVTCPLHYSRFDVMTGKVVSGPHIVTIEELKKYNLSDEMLKMVDQMNASMRAIKTYDLTTFRIQIKDNDIMVYV
jgi:nitrite reductase/ring-hydroxylating ferredoxin subunit